MEIRRLTICAAFLVLAVVSQCTEARYSTHSVQRRQADDEVNYDDDLQQADEASEDETQNDTDIRDTNEPVKQKPQANILTKGKSYEIKAGSNLVLECKVSPDDGTVVQWYKDNELYFMGNFKIQTDATRYSILTNSHDLEIKNVVPEDKGVYRCEVISVKTVSINHTVIVTEAPKILRFTATNGGSVVEGTDLLLTCNVTGLPPPNIVWSRDGKDGNQRLMETDGEFSENSVFLRNVKKEHSGKYYCYAFNSAGNNQSDLYITVAGKPRVHVPKTVVNSAVNVEAVLECSAHEDTGVHMRWYKDGRLIEDTSSRYTVSTRDSHSNLTVVPSSSDDFGTFTCEAENVHGKHNRSIELVQRPVLEDLSVEGSKLIWTVHSHQPLEDIEVQVKDLEGESDWMQISVPLPNAIGHKYEIIYNLEEKQLPPGKYQAVVKAKNNHSWSGNSEPVTLDIEARPQYIQHASIFRGNTAHSMRISSAMLSTVLMYLLVRMF